VGMVQRLRENMSSVCSFIALVWHQR